MRSIICICTALLCYSAGADDHFSLEILHMNDTHSNLVGTGLKVNIDGEFFTIPSGSVARTAAAINRIRDEEENVVFLLAGDLVQGTLFYTVYGGRADASVYNVLCPDAMTLGNHEFDRGSQGLSSLVDMLDFPVLCADIDVSGDSLLAGKFLPFTVLERGGESIGIIGVVTDEIADVSSPSSETLMLPLVETVQQYVDTLRSRGINKIILLSHIGYANDIQLASRLSSVDVIAGGHTHTLLGNFADMGISSDGDYPTVVTGLDGGTVLVVQAWCYGRVLGDLHVDFDSEGRVTDYAGKPVILTGEPYLNSSGEPLAGGDLEAFLDLLMEDSRISVADEDAVVTGLVETYGETISEFEQAFVAEATVDLPHIRVPGGALPGGSLIAPIVCDAMLWKIDALGIGADFALQNAGGVRIDIPEGEITVGTVYRLLPFGNTLSVLDVTGSEVRGLLEGALSGIFDNGLSDGAFPYVAGLKYTAVKNAPEGQRVTDIEIADSNGVYTAIDPGFTYRMVTNAFVASGEDGYALLAGKQFTDTGFTDSEILLEYLRMLGTVSPDEQRVFLVIND
jgi:5'-nucleotidase/UDP-sugar diphosphatase